MAHEVARLPFFARGLALPLITTHLPHGSVEAIGYRLIVAFNLAHNSSVGRTAVALWVPHNACSECIIGVVLSGEEQSLEIPEDIYRRVTNLCMALPEVTKRVDRSLVRTRSTAHSFDIRRRSFCLLVARERPDGASDPLIVLRADPDEREALLSMETPYFAPRARFDRIGVFRGQGTAGRKSVSW